MIVVAGQEPKMLVGIFCGRRDCFDQCRRLVRQNDSSDDILARADKALYRAKDAGHNRVIAVRKSRGVLHLARGPLARKVVALLSLRPLYAAAVSSVRLLFASSTTSSVMTVKRAKVAEPNVVEIATSAASRPRAMTIRPVRG